MNIPDIERREHYLNINYGIRSWLFTTDHKLVSCGLYFLSVTLFFFIGGIFATLIRSRAAHAPRGFGPIGDL